MEVEPRKRGRERIREKEAYYLMALWKLHTDRESVHKQTKPSRGGTALKVEPR